MAIFHMNFRGRSLLQRVLLGAMALAVLVLLFFFLAAALVAGTIIGIAILTRLWWLKRSLTQAARAEEITTEYTVIGREPPAQPRLPDEIPPDGSPRER